MSLSVLRTTGQASLHRSRWYLHGIEKIGKSLFASGWPRNAFITTEHRHDHLKGANILLLPGRKHPPTVQKWDDFLQIVDELDSDRCREEILTVTIDIVDLLYTYAEDSVLKKRKWEHQSDAEWGKGWRLVDREFEKPIHRLLTYPYGLIFISHTKLAEIRSLSGSRHKFMSTLPDRARRIILPHMGVIAYMGWDDEVYTDREGRRRYEERRMLFFESPDDLIEAGDGEGYLPEKLPTFEDPRRTFASIEDYYTGRRVADKNRSSGRR